MYTVADAMTAEPVTVKPEDDLLGADALMRAQSIRHLPVVHHGKLVGLLSQADVLRARGPGLLSMLKDQPVRAAMVADVVTTHSTVPLRRAARVLYERRISSLPVVDEERHVVGILTATDFIRFAAQMITDLDRVAATATRLREPHARQATEQSNR